MSRKTPVLIRRSGLTGTVFALTRYRQREDGLITVIGEGKHDVTADVEQLVAERCAPLVEAVERTIGNLEYLAMTNRIDVEGEGMLIDIRAALAAYRAAQGAGPEQAPPKPWDDPGPLDAAQGAGRGNLDVRYFGPEHDSGPMSDADEQA